MATTKKQPATKKREPAGKRRATKTRAASRAKGTGAGEFICPECGRSFSRAAALGAHRSSVHGVAGRRSAKRRAGARSARADGASSRSAPPASANRSSANGIDRDALLTALFKSGIPAREEVVRAATSWLDDAERLARMR